MISFRDWILFFQNENFQKLHFLAENVIFHLNMHCYVGGDVKIQKRENKKVTPPNLCGWVYYDGI